MTASTGTRLRRLGLDDLEGAAFVHRTSFDERLPRLTGLHMPDEDRWFYRERVFPECTLLGAIDSGVLFGIIALREGWIDQFYVLPDAQGRGVGTSLLDIAKRQAQSLSLWTFQRGQARHRLCGESASPRWMASARRGSEGSACRSVVPFEGAPAGSFGCGKASA